ncbi:hypothetical protein H310_09119 [Aphanomyces invadans]|uniref:Uncharacterized protein n=1 Tax=Aphanomyces invadans TaxID=157072 RepID=A0A024TUU7_9STRA|nr:hypothetical protein H310_09119 [Aphanomyces invadans]ETV97759.1 hypothetical protein H310_09119 [Aphanomyces invadans]|eukprot:XP_008873320.1 hypothetical protein H310_09119 [Aphanomyces invadans]
MGGVFAWARLHKLNADREAVAIDKLLTVQRHDADEVVVVHAKTPRHFSVLEHAIVGRALGHHRVRAGLVGNRARLQQHYSDLVDGQVDGFPLDLGRLATQPEGVLGRRGHGQLGLGQILCEKLKLRRDVYHRRSCGGMVVG